MNERLAKFPRERTWLLPALLEIQRAERWLSREALEAVAAHLRVPLSEVWEGATHYPELRLAEPGRRLVRVCLGVSCRARGATAVLQAFEQHLAVRAGQTTADGEVTLEPLDCAFACSMAPVVEVDHHFKGRVGAGDVESLLAPSHPITVVRSAPAGSPPSPLPSLGSPGARFAALKREAERRRTGARLAVGLGTCGLAVGAAETLEALRE